MLNANISKRRNYKTNKTACNLIKPGLLKSFGQINHRISEILNFPYLFSFIWVSELLFKTKFSLNPQQYVNRNNLNTLSLDEALKIILNTFSPYPLIKRQMVPNTELTEFRDHNTMIKLRRRLIFPLLLHKIKITTLIPS